MNNFLSIEEITYIVKSLSIKLTMGSLVLLIISTKVVRNNANCTQTPSQIDKEGKIPKLFY